jgi:hypothetical protein
MAKTYGQPRKDLPWLILGGLLIPFVVQAGPENFGPELAYIFSAMVTIQWSSVVLVVARWVNSRRRRPSIIFDVFTIFLGILSLIVNTTVLLDFFLGFQTNPIIFFPFFASLAATFLPKYALAKFPSKPPIKS